MRDFGARAVLVLQPGARQQLATGAGSRRAKLHSSSARYGLSRSASFWIQQSTPMMGLTPAARAARVELDHAEDVAGVGERQRRHAVGLRLRHRVVDADDAVRHRVLAVHPQVNETWSRHGSRQKFTIGGCVACHCLRSSRAQSSSRCRRSGCACRKSARPRARSGAFRSPFRCSGCFLLSLKTNETENFPTKVDSLLLCSRHRLRRRPRVLALVDPVHLGRQLDAARQPRLDLRHAGGLAAVAAAAERPVPRRARGGAARRRRCWCGRASGFRRPRCSATAWAW